VFAPKISGALPGGTIWGLQSERLFWRHATELGLLVGLGAHVPAALAELLATRPWWKAPSQLLGRLLAACQLGHYQQYRRMLASAKVAAALAAADWQAVDKKTVQQRTQADDGQRRYDASHGAARPRGRKRHGARRARRA
jgi:hypothetical protein